MLRTHLCSNLDEKNIGESVKLCGWCNTYRDHGGVIFIDLRDKSGIIQFFPDAEEFDGIPVPKPVGKEKVSVFGFKHIGKAYIVFIAYLDDRHKSVFYCYFCHGNNL